MKTFAMFIDKLKHIGHAYRTSISDINLDGPERIIRIVVERMVRAI